jgi:hypothetical protein
LQIAPTASAMLLMFSAPSGWDPRFREQRAPAALGPKPGLIRIGTVQRNTERERDVPLDSCRVVRHEVRGLRICERAADPFEHIGAFEQFFAQGPLAPVIERDEPQTIPRRPSHLPR